MNIQIDLLRDLGNGIRVEMSAKGYDVSALQNDNHKTLVAWSKSNRWAIPCRPRQVFKACGFDPAGHEIGVANLEQAILHGRDLRTYQTSKFTDINASDGLLDHWGIHHFHLGIETNPRSGLVRRTKHILLARIADDCAYFLKVAPHGSDSPDTWYQLELLEILHANWPESIESARARGVTEVQHKLSDQDIKALRRAHVTVSLQLADGTVYIEPNIGTFGDGTHWDDLTFANRTTRAARMIEQRVHDNYPQIRENARRVGCHFRTPPTFTLRAFLLGKYWDILEPETGYWFRINERGPA